MKSIDLGPFRNIQNVGVWCFNLASELWPINRSITGGGVRSTLSILQRELPGLTIESVPSGTAAFDWKVPDEWNVREAYIEDRSGTRVVDFANNNLHLLGYSEPVDTQLPLNKLQQHLYSLPNHPEAIPYVTSYYKRRWGFCLSHEQRLQLKDGSYRVKIDADLAPGELNYGELIIPGESKNEIFISTYICHPSMANNELSGPVVTAALAKAIIEKSDRRYSFRFVFVPETIGSIVYLSRNIDVLKKRVIAGFNVTCIGDDRCYSFLPSRDGSTKVDIIAQHVLEHIDPSYKRYSWLDRGSDERQYCAPGVDLPVTTIMRSKYGEYPEYHTSKDTLGEVVTAAGLGGGYQALRAAIEILEEDFVPLITTLGEPQLGKRGLYPDLSVAGSGDSVRDMMNAISFCDGQRTLFEIAQLINLPFEHVRRLIAPLVKAGLIIRK